MTAAEKDARRLIEAALQATSGVTFISSTAQVFIADRVKTAQALLATSISSGGREALVHITRARNFVEAIEAPRLREELEAALNALDGHRGLSGLGRGAEMPAELLPGPQEVPAPGPKPGGEPKRGWGFVILALILGVGLYKLSRQARD